MLTAEQVKACGKDCGARGCMRECMIHPEEQGRLRNRFHTPFRRRPAWKLAPADRPEAGE